MNKPGFIQHVVFALLSLLVVGTACEDRELDRDTLNGGSQLSEYWYTRQLTKAQLLELQRNYGLGFSYDAVYGGKCDMAAVRCQVLDVSAFDRNGMTIVSGGTHYLDTTYVTHSFSEYCQSTNLAGNVSGDVLIYTADYKKVASVYEHGMDTVTCFYNSRNLQVRWTRIDTTDIHETIMENPDDYLTPSFRYAIEKIRRAKDTDMMVVDSFIDIFGTHVVTDAKIGARLILDVKARRSDIHDYKSEETITNEKLNMLFAKAESSTTETEQAFLHQVLDNSTVNLKAKGGNVSVFNELITNLSYTNPDAEEETLKQWMESIVYDEKNPQSGNVELIDMAVAPIWLFITDAKTAGRVKSRIISSAPTMQEVYGNRNWVNTHFCFDMKHVETWVANQSLVKRDNPWICNVVAANRYVATLCREWVPEISEEHSVVVAYPIYENKIDLTSGLCVHNNKVYSVCWRYDRFVVREEKVKLEGNDFYLTCGCLSVAPVGGITYQPSHLLLGYEWPGSVNVADGSIYPLNGSQKKDSKFLTIRKFLGNFYLEDKEEYSNLPNWTYVKIPFLNAYYKDKLGNDKPFELSGIHISGNRNIENLTKRMMRNDNYTYYINTNEAWYEKQ